jgi:hypothetical protein
MSNQVILLCVSFIGASLTFYVNENLRQGPIRSSALLSLLVSLYCFFFPQTMDSDLVKTIPVVFIGSSFVGMVSARLLRNHLLIGGGGVIFCLIFLHTSKFFNGYGGALGTSAAIAVLAVLSIPIIGKKRRLTNGIIQLRKIMFRRSRRKRAAARLKSNSVKRY